MMMELQVKSLLQKRLIGVRMPMSLSYNKAAELWRSFMLKKKEIKNNMGQDLYSVQVYDPLSFKTFNPETVFEKWATIEVADVESVPEGMQPLVLPAGLYAVFFAQRCRKRR
jgi:AraC family transcriptional regulator